MLSIERLNVINQLIQMKITVVAVVEVRISVGSLATLVSFVLHGITVLRITRHGISSSILAVSQYILQWALVCIELVDVYKYKVFPFAESAEFGPRLTITRLQTKQFFPLSGLGGC